MRRLPEDVALLMLPELSLPRAPGVGGGGLLLGILLRDDVGRRPTHERVQPRGVEPRSSARCVVACSQPLRRHGGDEAERWPHVRSGVRLLSPRLPRRLHATVVVVLVRRQTRLELRHRHVPEVSRAHEPHAARVERLLAHARLRLPLRVGVVAAHRRRDRVHQVLAEALVPRVLLLRELLLVRHESQHVQWAARLQPRQPQSVARQDHDAGVQHRREGEGVQRIQHRVEADRHVQQRRDAVLEALVEPHHLPPTAPRCRARDLAHAALDGVLHPRRKSPRCLVGAIPRAVHRVLVLQVRAAQAVREHAEAVAEAAEVRLQHVLGSAEADGHVAVHERQRLAAQMAPQEVEQVAARHLRADLAHRGLALHLLELLAEHIPVATTL